MSAVHPGDPAASSPELGAPLGEASGQVCGALRRKPHRGRWLGLSGAEKVGTRAGRKGALTSSRQREEAGQGGHPRGAPSPPPTALEQERWGWPGGLPSWGRSRKTSLLGLSGTVSHGFPLEFGLMLTAGEAGFLFMIEDRNIVARLMSSQAEVTQRKFYPLC